MTKLQIRLLIGAAWCIVAGLLLLAFSVRYVPHTYGAYPMVYDRWTGTLRPIPVTDPTAERAVLGFEKKLQELKISPSMILPEAQRLNNETLQ